MSKVTPQQAKEALLLVHAGKTLTFNTNPPVTVGRIHAHARGFWVYRREDKRVLAVSGKRWAGMFARGEKEVLDAPGGRIAIGLAGVKGEEDLKRLQDYVPGIIKEVVLATDPKISGWTIGQFGYGYWKAPDGTVFDDRSLVVHFAGITSEQLQEIGRALAEGLNQSRVLVFDDNTGESYLQGQTIEEAPDEQTSKPMEQPEPAQQLQQWAAKKKKK